MLCVNVFVYKTGWLLNSEGIKFYKKKRGGEGTLYFLYRLLFISLLQLIFQNISRINISQKMAKLFSQEIKDNLGLVIVYCICNDNALVSAYYILRIQCAKEKYLLYKRLFRLTWFPSFTYCNLTYVYYEQPLENYS